MENQSRLSLEKKADLNNIFFVGMVCLLFVSLALNSVHAADSSLAEASHNKKTWQIEARRLTFYHESNVVMGEGDVKVTNGDMKVYADYLVYDRKNSVIWASGHMVIHMKKDVIRGKSGRLELNTQRGEIEGAELFLQRNNVYVTADSITKTGPEEYHAVDATISTCKLPDQAWRIRARDLTLTVNGNAIAKHTTFDVKDWPVFYTPWASVPLNKYRKTGVLIPGYISSKRNGFGLYVPFFLVLNDSMDITYYPHYMTKRGFLQGFEYRHVFSDEDVAVFRYNFLYDQETDNDYNDDGYTRGNSFRWWIRGKMNQRLPWGFKAKLDLDLVSDRDYTEEFNVGETGFSASNNVFKKYFHRSLAYRTDAIRPSKLQVTRNFDDEFVAGLAQYNDNHDTGMRKYTVQTLPSVVATGFKQRLFNTPLYYDYNTSFTNYWRESGTRESRFNINPNIMMPVNLLGWADVVFNAGLINTSYWTGGESETENPSDTANRLLYRFSADASKTFGRTFRMASGSLWRHTFRPRLLYELQPAVDQDDLPYIDSFDRLPQRSRLSISLLSFLSSRSRRATGQFSYRDMVRLDLVQRFNFVKEPLYAVPTLEDNPEESMSEFYTELEIKPWRWFYVRYDSRFNHYNSAFTTHNVTANVSSRAGDRLNLYYRYNHITDVNQVGVDMNMVLLPSVMFAFNLNQDFEGDSQIQSRYALTYQGSCWSLTGLLSNNRDDTSISFNIGLRGIGNTASVGSLGSMNSF